ncbi:MAG: cytochrome b/b6 domain-containing protein [Deltaproteobacteria bacterium]|nr:cytochrome b/b6 domain-containing protein [Deltaproteobacteria bacterium]
MTTTKTTKILVWDLPTRLFHGLLALAFVGAWGIATAVDDDSALFPVHALFGLVMAFMVALRLVWGVVGTRHARLSALLVGPRAVAAYVVGVFRGTGGRHTGHNPGSAVAIVAIFAEVAVLTVTGVLMGSGSHAAKEVHEVFATLLLVTVLLHVAGVVIHSLRFKENLAMSMVDGRKVGDEGAAIRGARPLVALAFLALTALWGAGLASGYDGATRRVTLPVVGQTLDLGEVEGGERGGGGHHGRRHGDDDD